MIIDEEGSMHYMVREEVEGLIDANNQNLSRLRLSHLEHFNEKITATNIVSKQCNEIEHLTEEVERKTQRVAIIKSKIADKAGLSSKTKEVFNDTLSPLLKDLEKFKEIRAKKREASKNVLKRRSSLTGNPLQGGTKRSSFLRPFLTTLNKTMYNEGAKTDEFGSDDDEQHSEQSEPDSAHLKPKLSLESMNENQLVEFLASLKTRADTLKTQMKKVKQHYSNANSNLHIFLKQAETKLNEIYTCRNCFQKFTYQSNTEKNCCSHSGRIQFFSCSECGSDEYFSCCNMCSECNRGCKTAYHIPYTPYITKQPKNKGLGASISLSIYK